MDTSIHDWLEGRGETMVLVAMIDDATGRIEAGFYPGETVEAHFDLLGRWLKKHGRPRRQRFWRLSFWFVKTEGPPHRCSVRVCKTRKRNAIHCLSCRAGRYKF
jgi:hypothetical protein